ncbi:EamA family transporter [Candidatus Peregrinibacteria bacterium]|nr:EamA family transporter [Candidatus Peregrinibacteria bacterium]
MNYWLLFTILTPLLWGMTHPIDAGLRRSFIKNEESLTWFFAFFHLPLAILAFFVFDIELIFNLNVALIILAGTFWTLPAYFYFKSVKFESASTVALLLQMIPLCTLVIAYFFIDESLSGIQLAAFFVILFGGILAAMKIKKNALHFSKAFWFMLIGCIMWAISNVSFKYFEPDFINFTSAFVYYFFGSSLPALLLLLHPKKLKSTAKSFRKLPASAWSLLLLSRSASLGGSLSLSYAVTLGKASLTTVMMGIQPFFALLFGFLFSIFFKFIPRESLDMKNWAFKILALLIVIFGLILLQI